jgi:hypothetical protein
MQDPFIDPPNRQRRNQRRTDPTTILSRLHLHRITSPPTIPAHAVLFIPVKDLAQRLGLPALEVGVFAEERAVGADVAFFPFLLLGDGGDAAGGQSRGAGADQLGEAADQGEFVLGGVEGEGGLEEVEGVA